uniref:Uncharacterized protein n=1 Tax=Melopsittacus undulatus TaxID=13146 RepID=A0A8V5GXX7_MELUD
MGAGCGAANQRRAAEPIAAGHAGHGANGRRPRCSRQPIGGSAAGMEAGAALGRRLLWALPAYAAGLLGLRAPALLLALALYAGWRRRRRARERALSAAARLQRDEEAAVRAAAKRLGLSNGELPAWVSVGGGEGSGRGSSGVPAWPFFGQFMEKLLQAQVAPAIRASSPHLQSFTFTRVDMGEKVSIRPPGGVRVPQPPPTSPPPSSYVGDICIDVEVKKFFCKAGVKGMQVSGGGGHLGWGQIHGGLHGTLRIILEPLLGDVPIVGALSMFFIRRPTLDINWTGMTNLLDIPGLSSLSDAVLMDAIASFLVLPNRLLVPLVPDLPEAAELRSPVPRGALRVQLRAARGLRSKDRFLGGLLESRSDPYAELRVGTQGVRSRVVRSDLDPVWDELHEFVVHEVPGQELEVEIFDKDPDQDDFLGMLWGRDVWGRDAVGGAGMLWGRDAVGGAGMLWGGQGCVGGRDAVGGSALLGGSGLPPLSPWVQLRPPGRVPSPMVQISVQDVTMESKVVPSSTAPVWEAAFRFFLHDPRSQEVEFQVKDEGGQPLGALSLPLPQLLASEGLSLDAWFPLAGGGPNSQVLLACGGGRAEQPGGAAPAPAPHRQVQPFPPPPQNPAPQPLGSPPMDDTGGGAWGGVPYGCPHVVCWGVGGVPMGPPHVVCCGVLTLCPPSPPTAEAGLGQVQLSLWYHRDGHKLVAIVHGCRSLRPQGKELPDPYVSLLLLPERGRSKRKTGTQRRTLDPDFNERFEWDLSLEEASQRRLEARVKSCPSFMARDKEVLGKVMGGPGGSIEPH